MTTHHWGAVVRCFLMIVVARGPAPLSKPVALAVREASQHSRPILGFTRPASAGLASSCHQSRSSVISKR